MANKKEYFNQVHKQIVLGCGASANIRKPSDINSFLLRVKADLTSFQYYINEIAYNIFRLGCYGPKWEFDIMQDGIAATTLQTFPEEHGGSPWGPECYWVSDGTPTGGRPATIKETLDCILAMQNQQIVQVETAEQDLTDIYDKLLCLANDDQRIVKDVFGCDYQLNCDDSPTQQWPVVQHLFQIFDQIVEGHSEDSKQALNGICSPSDEYPNLFINISSCDITWSEDCLVPQAFVEGCPGVSNLFEQWNDIYSFVGAGCAIDGIILDELVNPNDNLPVEVACFGAAAGQNLSLSQLLGLTAHEVCLRTKYAYKTFELSPVDGSTGIVEKWNDPTDSDFSISADNMHDVLKLKAGNNIKLVGKGVGDVHGDDEIEIHAILPEPPTVPDSILGDLNDAYHFSGNPPIWFGIIALENTYEESNSWTPTCKPKPGAGIYLVDDDTELDSKLFSIVKNNRRTLGPNSTQTQWLEPEQAWFSVGKHWGLKSAGIALSYTMEPATIGDGDHYLIAKEGAVLPSDWIYSFLGDGLNILSKGDSSDSICVVAETPTRVVNVATSGNSTPDNISLSNMILKDFQGVDVSGQYTQVAFGAKDPANLLPGEYMLSADNADINNCIFTLWISRLASHSSFGYVYFTVDTSAMQPISSIQEIYSAKDKAVAYRNTLTALEDLENGLQYEQRIIWLTSKIESLTAWIEIEEKAKADAEAYAGETITSCDPEYRIDNFVPHANEIALNYSLNFSNHEVYSIALDGVAGTADENTKWLPAGSHVLGTLTTTALVGNPDPLELDLSIVAGASPAGAFGEVSLSRSANNPSMPSEVIENEFHYDANSGEIWYSLSRPIAGYKIKARTSKQILTIGSFSNPLPYSDQYQLLDLLILCQAVLGNQWADNEATAKETTSPSYYDVNNDGTWSINDLITIIQSLLTHTPNYSCRSFSSAPVDLSWSHHHVVHTEDSVLYMQRQPERSDQKFIVPNTAGSNSTNTINPQTGKAGPPTHGVTCPDEGAIWIQGSDANIRDACGDPLKQDYLYYRMPGDGEIHRLGNCPGTGTNVIQGGGKNNLQQAYDHDANSDGSYDGGSIRLSKEKTPDGHSPFWVNYTTSEYLDPGQDWWRNSQYLDNTYYVPFLAVTQSNREELDNTVANGIHNIGLPGRHFSVQFREFCIAECCCTFGWDSDGDWLDNELFGAFGGVYIFQLLGAVALDGTSITLGNLGPMTPSAAVPVDAVYWVRDSYLTAKSIPNNTVASGKAGDCANLTLLASRSQTHHMPAEAPALADAGFGGTGSGYGAVGEGEAWTAITVSQVCLSFENDWSLTLDPNYTATDSNNDTYVLLRGDMPKYFLEDCDETSQCCCDNYDVNSGEGSFLYPLNFQSTMLDVPWNDEVASMNAGPDFGSMPAAGNMVFWLTAEEKDEMFNSFGNWRYKYSIGDCAHVKYSHTVRRLNTNTNAYEFFNVINNLCLKATAESEYRISYEIGGSWSGAVFNGSHFSDSKTRFALYGPSIQGDNFEIQSDPCSFQDIEPMGSAYVPTGNEKEEPCRCDFDDDSQAFLSEWIYPGLGPNYLRRVFFLSQEDNSDHLAFVTQINNGMNGAGSFTYTADAEFPVVYNGPDQSGAIVQKNVVGFIPWAWAENTSETIVYSPGDICWFADPLAGGVETPDLGKVCISVKGNTPIFYTLGDFPTYGSVISITDPAVDWIDTGANINVEYAPIFSDHGPPVSVATAAEQTSITESTTVETILGFLETSKWLPCDVSMSVSPVSFGWLNSFQDFSMAGLAIIGVVEGTDGTFQIRHTNWVQDIDQISFDISDPAGTAITHIEGQPLSTSAPVSITKGNWTYVVTWDAGNATWDVVGTNSTDHLDDILTQYTADPYSITDFHLLSFTGDPRTPPISNATLVEHDGNGNAVNTATLTALTTSYNCEAWENLLKAISANFSMSSTCYEWDSYNGITLGSNQWNLLAGMDTQIFRRFVPGFVPYIASERYNINYSNLIDVANIFSILGSDLFVPSNFLPNLANGSYLSSDRSTVYSLNHASGGLAASNNMTTVTGGNKVAITSQTPSVQNFPVGNGTLTVLDIQAAANTAAISNVAAETIAGVSHTLTVVSPPASSADLNDDEIAVYANPTTSKADVWVKSTADLASITFDVDGYAAGTTHSNTFGELKALHYDLVQRWGVPYTPTTEDIILWKNTMRSFDIPADYRRAKITMYGSPGRNTSATTLDDVAVTTNHDSNTHVAGTWYVINTDAGAGKDRQTGVLNTGGDVAYMGNNITASDLIVTRRECTQFPTVHNWHSPLYFLCTDWSQLPTGAPTTGENEGVVWVGPSKVNRDRCTVYFREPLSGRIHDLTENSSGGAFSGSMGFHTGKGLSDPVAGETFTATGANHSFQPVGLSGIKIHTNNSSQHGSILDANDIGISLDVGVPNSPTYAFSIYDFMYNSAQSMQAVSGFTDAEAATAYGNAFQTSKSLNTTRRKVEVVNATREVDKSLLVAGFDPLSGERGFFSAGIINGFVPFPTTSYHMMYRDDLDYVIKRLGVASNKITIDAASSTDALLIDLGSVNLVDLNDTDLNSDPSQIADGSRLVWNGTADKWEASTGSDHLSVGTGVDILQSSTPSVEIRTLEQADVANNTAKCIEPILSSSQEEISLQFVGVMDSITDVDLTGIQNNDVLIWDSSTSKWKADSITAPLIDPITINGNSVGINVANSTEMLEVGGNVVVTGAIECSNISSSTADLDIASDSDIDLLAQDNIFLKYDLSNSNSRLGIFSGNAEVVTLDTDGNILTTGVVKATGGTSATNVAYGGGNNTGMYFPSQHVIRFSNNGSANVTISADGNVGIGATSPTEKLHLLTPDDGDGMLLENVSTGASFVTKYIAGSGYQLKLDDDNNATTIFFRSYGNSYLNTGGNFGIGTTSPSEKLHVEDGNVLIQDGALTIQSQASNHAIKFQSSVSNEARILAHNFNLNAAHPLKIGGNTLRFSVDSAGTTDAMFIDSNGNVGIGTESPSYALEVKGQSDYLARFYDSNNGSVGLIEIGTMSIYVDNNMMRFRNGADVLQLKLHNNGNVGIGTETPAEKLEVDGNVKISDVLKLTPSATPGSASAGDIYFDSTTNKLRVYTGAQWEDLH